MGMIHVRKERLEQAQAQFVASCHWAAPLLLPPQFPRRVNRVLCPSGSKFLYIRVPYLFSSPAANSALISCVPGAGRQV